MNAGAVLGTIGTGLSVATAIIMLYRGWRKRVQDAAKKPFQAGVEAVNEAELALRLKDRRLEEMAKRETEALTELERSRAANLAQQEQIASLYADIGRLQVKNAALEEGARLAAEREQADRRRIGELEMKLSEMAKHLGLGQ